MEASFPEQAQADVAKLSFGSITTSVPFGKGATSCYFNDLDLAEGNARLEIVLECGDGAYGIWKARVHRSGP